MIYQMIFSDNMGPKTRQKVENKYGGPPEDLPEADLPTLRDIVKYVHKLEMDGFSQDSSDIVNHVSDKLLYIWQKVNPRLVILEKKTIKVKLLRSIDRLKTISWGRASKSIKSGFEKKLDKLYDICACSCKLEEVECSSKSAKCSVDNCSEVHILCICPMEVKVYFLFECVLKFCHFTVLEYCHSYINFV